MTAREHANLLSIFAWVYAGIQSLFVGLYLLIILLYGGVGIAMALDSKGDDAAGLVIFAFFVLLFGLIALLGIVCLISNIWFGKRLRSVFPPTQRSMILTAILNCVSWVCGGILLMPIGIGLGIYAIWFSQWDAGKAFLEGREFKPNYAFPPNPQYYSVSQHDQASSDRPHKWT